MKTIKAKDFSKRLVNRNPQQGDGKKTAIEFRDTYLTDLFHEGAWDNDEPLIAIDFEGIQKMSPSFADEAFGFFAQFADPERIKKKIKFINMSTIQEKILNMELKDAYGSIKKNA